MDGLFTTITNTVKRAPFQEVYPDKEPENKLLLSGSVSEYFDTLTRSLTVVPDRLLDAVPAIFPDRYVN